MSGMCVTAELRDCQMFVVKAPRVISLAELERESPDAMALMDSQLENELAGDATITLDPGWSGPPRLYVTAGSRRYHWHRGARVWTRFARGHRTRPSVADDGTIAVRAVIGIYQVVLHPRHTKRSAPKRQLELACSRGRRSRPEDPLGYFTGPGIPGIDPDVTAVLDTIEVSYQVVLE